MLIAKQSIYPERNSKKSCIDNLNARKPVKLIMKRIVYAAYMLEPLNFVFNVISSKI